MKKNLRLLNPLYWPAWLALGILWLITRLPVSWQMQTGKALGGLLYVFPTKLKRTTETNIRLCFPDLSADQQKKLVKKNFASLGIGLIETGMAWWMSDEKLRNNYQVHGLEHLDNAFLQGKGVILLGPHFTCLEIVAKLVSKHYSFAVMYRPHKKPLISFIHEQFRATKAIQYIPRNRVRDVLRTLEENKAIWYAYDVDGGKKRSVFAPLFGIETASLTAVTRFVELTGAAIVPISFYRRDNEFFYDIYLSPALENFPSNNLRTDASRLNASLEQAIRKKPEQYVWQYKRFKTRPNGEPRLY